jgi:hypothetical protein
MQIKGIFVFNPYQTGGEPAGNKKEDSKQPEIKRQNQDRTFSSGITREKENFMSFVEVNEKWTKRKTNKKSFVGVSRWGFCLRGGYWSFLNASI